ncbi:DUF4890 domain-containing protein [Pontibacter sp. 172403-2]|uniref:DUF4890 domain-containing protein n=1 Tax=Pontibacter rufus TaxID=2791028 RepID=UPI0018AFF7B0|nr:DUF4890 domain-containing protein [Pontibacter sp. 172403-2]MBF9255212.1 DUF4890 domain-containing protein [Pontibacter sp. 172403-2]
MKKVVIALSFGILMAGSSFAQSAPQQEAKFRTEHRNRKDKGDRKSPEERAAQRTEKLSKQLGLSKSQEKKLLALNLENIREMQAMRANHNKGDKRSTEQREHLKASREKRDAALKDILTKKQYAQYQQQREEMKAQHKGRQYHKGNRERSQKYNG